MAKKPRKKHLKSDSVSPNADRDANGRFVAGNSLWRRARADYKPGAPRKYQNGKDFFEKAIQYFEWLEENPVEVEEVAVSQGNPVRYDTYRKRPPTFDGLCSFMGITMETLRDYRIKTDYYPEIEMIEALLRGDKLEGALTNQYNPSVVSRVLGLTEKIEGTSVTVNFNKDDSDL